MDIGERLKEAREDKGISLDHLQETTKIQKRYLTAIEQGNFHILPGKFYARAFIREYAQAVGLDHQELLDDFSEEVPKEEVKEPEELSRLQRSRRADDTSKSPAIFSIIPAVIVALLVIGIIFVAVILNQKSTSNTDTNANNNQGKNEIIRDANEADKNMNSNENQAENEEESANEDETANNKTSEEEKKDNTTVIEDSLTFINTVEGTKPESTFELIYSEDTLVLKFEPTGESWLDITNESSETIFGGMTQANNPIEVDVTGQDKVRINIGYAPNLPKILINDMELEYPVDPNKSVNQRIWIEINKETE